MFQYSNVECVAFGILGKFLQPFPSRTAWHSSKHQTFSIKQSSAASSLPLFLVACDMRKMPSLAAMIPTVL
jgi:hypothetical protein